MAHIVAVSHAGSEVHVVVAPVGRGYAGLRLGLHDLHGGPTAEKRLGQHPASQDASGEPFDERSSDHLSASTMTTATAAALPCFQI